MLQYDRAIFSLNQQKRAAKERLIDSKVWKQSNVTSHKDLAGIAPNGPNFYHQLAQTHASDTSSNIVNGLSSTTPSGYDNTLRTIAVGMKNTLSGRPDPIQGQPPSPFAMSSFTRTVSLLQKTKQ